MRVSVGDRGGRVGGSGDAEQFALERAPAVGGGAGILGGEGGDALVRAVVWLCCTSR